MVFQQFNLFPHMTRARERHRGAGLRARRIAREARRAGAKNCSIASGIEREDDARPASSPAASSSASPSPGRWRWSPTCILFDEPTSALDPKMAGEVLAVMSDLAAGGQTMIVVTHAMGFVRRSAHTVHVLAEGQIIESGPPQQIFDQPQHPRARAAVVQRLSFVGAAVPRLLLVVACEVFRPGGLEGLELR